MTKTIKATDKLSAAEVKKFVKTLRENRLDPEFMELLLSVIGKIKSFSPALRDYYKLVINKNL